jgi:hypothetical protein
MLPSRQSRPSKASEVAGAGSGRAGGDGGQPLQPCASHHGASSEQHDVFAAAAALGWWRK